MAVTDNLLQSLVSLVGSQKMFTQPQYTASKNYLISRNESELFLSCGNIVRCCQINTQTNSYRILDQKSSREIAIESLLMNPSGSMIALIGNVTLGVFTIPKTIWAGSFNIPNGYYEISSFSSGIKKVIWHPAIPNDSGLVVLDNASCISLFNVTISTSTPQLYVDLNTFDNFKGKKATSISFGSEDKLSGNLTLYVSTNTGEIFAIYPFVNSDSCIRSTKSQVESLHKEATACLQFVNTEYPSSNLLEVVNGGGLKGASLEFYQYAHNLKKGSEDYLIRNADEKTEPILELDQRAPFKSEICLQGPLTISNTSNVESETKVSILDIVSINSNDEVSILMASCKDEKDKLYVKYLIQDTPLIMKWTGYEDAEASELVKDVNVHKASTIKVKEEKEEPQVKRFSLKYVKPKKGFGFLDFRNDVQEGDIHEEVVSQSSEQMKTEIKFLENLQQEEFWNENFRSLKLAGNDYFTNGGNTEVSKIIVLNSSRSKLSIIVNKKIFIIDTDKWASEVIFKGIGDVENIQYDLFEAKYSDSTIALVSDTIGNTGSFLIIYYGNLNNDIEVRKLTSSTQTPLISNPKPSEFQQPIIRPTRESILSKLPFEELESQLTYLKKFDPSDFYDQTSKRVLKDSLKTENHGILRATEKISILSLKQTKEFEKAFLSVQSRINMQVSELIQQVQLLKKVDQYVSNSDNLDDRIKTLLDKQETIAERERVLQNKLVDAINRLRTNKGCGLSKAENLWIKELNAFNIKINKDSERDISLVNKFTELKKQFTTLKENLESGKAEKEEGKELHERLKSLQIGQDVTKLKGWIQQEAKLIDAATHKIDENLAKVVSIV